MHDLNAKKLKHAQAKRNPQYIEAHRPTKWDIPLLFIACVTFILVNAYGV